MNLIKETNLYSYNNKIYLAETENAKSDMKKLIDIQFQLKRKSLYLQWLGLDLRLKGIHTWHLGWSEYRDTYDEYKILESKIKILEEKCNI